MKNIIALCLISTCVFAKKLDFESLLNIAIESNPKIQALNDEIDALESASVIAGTGGYFLTPIKTANGNQEWRVGLSQKLPWFGKLPSQRKVVLIQRDMAKTHLEAFKLKLQTDILTSFVSLWKLHKTIEIFEQSSKALDHLEHVVLSRYVNSTAGQSDVVQIQIKSLKVKDDLRSTKDKIPTILESIYALSGIENLQIDSNNLPVLSVGEYSYFNNPQYVNSQLIIEQSQINEKLSRLNSFPDFTFGVDYVSLESNDSNVDPLMVKLGLNIPIWFGKNSAQKRMTKSQSKSSKLPNLQISSCSHNQKFQNNKNKSKEYNQKDIENTLKSKQENIKYSIQNGEEKIKLYEEKLIPQAQTGFASAESAYLSDYIDFSSYLELYQLTLSLEKELIQLNADLLIAKANYLEWSGKLIGDYHE